MFYGIFSKKKQNQYKFSPIALSFYFCVVSFIATIPFSLFEILHKSIVISHIHAIHIFAIIEIGVIGTSLFYFTYQKALQKSSEVTAALFTYLQPVATIIFSILLLGEQITLLFIIGSIMAVVGAQIASKK